MSTPHTRRVSEKRRVDEQQLIQALNGIKAKRAGQSHKVDQPVVKSVTFGTTEDCDIRITDDPYISNRHCRISELQDGSVVVEDLGSTNGTTVRPAGQSWMAGSRVYGPTPIRPGMVVRIGHTDLPWQ